MARSRQRRSSARSAWAVTIVAVVSSAHLLVACGGTPPTPAEGVAHVHGLGINPADGDLYAASHHGLFRIDAEGRAERVGKLVQDTMGFTVVGPDHFLASGHPDINDRRLRRPRRPPLLGLLESTDGGRTWEPRSLLGEADFHALVAAHGKVYGYDSTGGRFMVSPDGERWETRSRLGIGGFAVDPSDADHLVAMTERGLAESRDGGRSWEPSDGPELAFLSWAAEPGPWGMSPTGEVYQQVDGRWQPRTAVSGQAQALLVTGDELFAAVSSGGSTTIYVSSDGGRSWRVRYADGQP